MTQAQVSSFSALSTLCGGSRSSLEQVRQLVEALGINRSSPGTGLGETATLGELNRLVAMAEDLDDIVVSVALSSRDPSAQTKNG
ncbi:unnamed protein product [Ectocarpus sp. CCAP 1310/34]|nr:unnamed protein product [Ectocarpus sp. CCAP 1310/34]